ncbi:cephalosporin hydroxylase [Tepidamorphus gemmatus]|jgi:cephalosporin hydroxylase|uniref:Cephalosporin hydroxylase n=1 Tax=Tepidamorphus gemmatus TaxID=747076 RepID=A0A4R3M9K8_9HYPH|nr:CmcI family methyltransferase [Tepidamorphus gemmatus]TCT09876.1 cephalosporin hydroxylase [Tepidamorphus gemmatus]
MKFQIDTDRAEIISEDGRRTSFWSDEGFAFLTDLWVKSGWNQKHNYTFTWFGIPVIQLPEDMIRYQEVVCTVKPDVIIETGIAHGGSLVYSATLCRMLGKGRVIGVDIEIRPHNRARLAAHPLIGMITMFEGSSVDPQIVGKVRAEIAPDETVMVVLDSNHTYAHVTAELEAYAPMVTPGSYIVATDGIMRDLADTPRGRPEWTTDNPAQAARDFVARNPDFVIEQPAWAFNESTLSKSITHWPDAWIRRIR